jgi:PAS domain S-box-containing protein
MQFEDMRTHNQHDQHDQDDQRYYEITNLIAGAVYSFRFAADGTMISEWGAETFSKITGYHPDELDLQRWHEDLIHPEDVSIMIERIERFHARQPAISEYRIITKDGEIRWLRDHGRPVWDEQANGLVRIYGAVEDITEQKKTQAALDAYQQHLAELVEQRTAELRESETRYRMLAHYATDIISRHNTDGVYLYASPASHRLLGYMPGELVGRSAYELLHPEDVDQVRNAHMQTLQSSELLHCQYRMLHRAGHYIWIESTGRAIRGPQSGKVIEVIVVSRDITERIEMQEAYRTLVDHSLQGLVIFQDGQIVFANAAMSLINGYSVEEMLAMTPDEVGYKLIHPDDLPRVWQYMLDRMAGRPAPTSYEYRVVCKDGTFRWLEAHGIKTTYRGRDAVQGTYIDITERKNAEEQLRESERRFRMLAENAQDIIFRFRLSEPRGFEYISPSITSIFGYTPEEYYADLTLHVRTIHPDDLPRFEAFRRSPADYHEPLVLRYIRKDGREIWIEQRQWPMFDEQGNAVAIEGITRDITERKHAEQQLLQQQHALAMLRERERLARELHDSFGQVLGYINTQIATVRELIASGKTAQADMHLERMHAVTQETHADIRGFILGVQTGGTLEYGFFPSVVRYLERYEHIYGIQTELRVPPELTKHSFAPAVETHLVRIIQEALTNARKHASPSSVCVSFAQMADQVQLCIEDDGCGFYFPQAQQVHDRAGYGLQSIRERAREIDATVQFDTAPGSGTRLLVQFPRKSSDALLVQTMRVMLVDDHPLFLEGLQNMLAARGIAVIDTAHNGTEALEKARLHQPEVILMDVEMPGCNGLEATRRIKAEFPETQIVMLTVSADDDYLFAAIKSGASGYLLKNLDASDFFTLLAGLEQGEVALSPGMAKKMMHEFAQQDQPAERARTIDHTVSGHTHPPPASSEHTSRNGHRQPHNQPETGGDSELQEELDDLQREILSLVAQEYTYREVGERVGYSERSIKKFMRQIIATLHLRNRAAAIAYARQQGLVGSEE